MKNSFTKLMTAVMVILSGVMNAQIKNAATKQVKIYGNCGMCKTTIEKAGNVKKTTTVDWNHETQMATITYNTKKTTEDEILKRIALAGYDSDKFLAPDAVYNGLHGCCQYDRLAKVAAKEETAIDTDIKDSNHKHAESTTTEIQKENQLKVVFDKYFLIKEGLIASEANKTASAATALLAAIDDVKTDSMETEVQIVWTKVLNQVKETAARMSQSTDIKQQRDHLNVLSLQMYTLIKAVKYEVPVYFQFCPMYNDGKGANWLSRENAIKNPYYGPMMLTCGKVVETIK